MGPQRIGSSAQDTEVVGMTTKTHQRIIVESEKVGKPPREGDILEVIEAEYGTRYRVAWDDGHESTFRPSAGSAQVVPAEKAPTKQK
jgi:transcription elongation factor